MPKFPNTPATEETIHKCIVLWALESVCPQGLTQAEVHQRAGEIIDAKLGQEHRVLWPPFNGTREVYEHLQEFGDVETVRAVHLQITDKGLESIRSMEKRFLLS